MRFEGIVLGGAVRDLELLEEHALPVVGMNLIGLWLAAQ
jgi:regulator of RNase E activity RraA